MISRETWGRIIRDFQEFELPELVERDLEVRTDLPVRRAISILGPRRTGKTFLMFQIIKKLLERGIEKSNVLYVNLENDLLLGCELSDLRRMIETFYEIYPESRGQKVYLFLDEVQNVLNWEKFVRAIMDTENIQVQIQAVGQAAQPACCYRLSFCPEAAHPSAMGWLCQRPRNCGQTQGSQEHQQDKGMFTQAWLNWRSLG